MNSSFINKFLGHNFFLSKTVGFFFCPLTFCNVEDKPGSTQFLLLCKNLFLPWIIVNYFLYPFKCLINFYNVPECEFVLVKYFLEYSDCTCFRLSLKSFYSRRGVKTCSISFAWEPDRNPEPQTPDQLNQTCNLMRPPPSWFTCTFEKYRSKNIPLFVDLILIFPFFKFLFNFFFSYLSNNIYQKYAMPLSLSSKGL